MLDRIAKAGGKLRGILWYQGESDCNLNDSATYADRFDQWIAAVREDTGIPDLPVVVVQLSRFVLAEEQPGMAESWDNVRYAQLELPERIEKTAVTPAIDLQLSDSIHVGTQGLIRLGKRMAKQVQALDKGELAPGPKVTGVKHIKGPLGSDMIEVSTTQVTGGLRPAENAFGFQVWAEDGSPLPLLRVVDASVDPKDGTKLRILLNAPFEGKCLLTYGRGTNPSCNVVDEADMALPCFRAVVDAGA
jgi:sialate O-acetylesterase